MASARRPRGAAGAIPDTPLIAACAFGSRLAASQVARAIARGLSAGAMAPADVCLLASPPDGHGGRASARARRELLELLAASGFDERMRRACALIVAERCLQEPTLQRSAAFELATRARQAGVPAYAVTRENRLDRFDARILDLQAILEAGGARGLEAAGRTLAQLMRPPAG
jgi:glycerate kinase